MPPVDLTARGDEEVPEPRRLSWACPVCRQRIYLRYASEDEAKFHERCRAHERAGRVCTARVLIKQLKADGLVPLRRAALNDFIYEYMGLNDAGLVQWHPTHIVGDSYVRSSPWGPAWAARYDQYLRLVRKQSLRLRVVELREAAETPESIDRALAFLVFAHADEVDLGGAP